MRKPKLRELKEALRAVFSRRFTTRYPFEPHTPPDGFRGKPEFHEDDCIGCNACTEVCPALAITIQDHPEASPPVRKIIYSCDKCIFCGQCELYCTTGKGITLSKNYNLCTLDRSSLTETAVEYELVLCEICSAIVGTRKHLRWVAEKLGAKAYANPTLIVSTDGSMRLAAPDSGRGEEPALARNDMMRIMCPACRRTMVVRELWGE